MGERLATRMSRASRSTGVATADPHHQVAESSPAWVFPSLQRGQELPDLDGHIRANVAEALQCTAGNGATRSLLRHDDDHNGEYSPAFDPERIAASEGGGSALDPRVRRRLERSLGASLVAARVHTDRRADELTSAVGAVAFTTGQDIFFRSGAYSPRSREGLRLLAHEAAHTLQQAAGPVSGTIAGDRLAISHRDDPFERAATSAATAAVMDRRAKPRGVTPHAVVGHPASAAASIQRQDDPDKVPAEQAAASTYSLDPRRGTAEAQLTNEFLKAQAGIDLSRQSGTFAGSGHVGPLSARLNSAYGPGGVQLSGSALGEFGPLTAGAAAGTGQGASFGAMLDADNLKIGGALNYNQGLLGGGLGVGYAAHGFEAGGSLTFGQGGLGAGASARWTQDQYAVGARVSDKGGGVMAEGPVPGWVPFLPPGSSVMAGANVGSGGLMPPLGALPGTGANGAPGTLLPGGPFVRGYEHGPGGFAQLRIPGPYGVSMTGGVRNIGAGPVTPLLGIEGQLP